MKLTEENIENVVIGSGAAGFQALLRLHQNGETDSAMITEDLNAGTSRNTGSDKQTYYKLSLAGKDPDSVGEMAEDLFACGAVDGDMALCEAALSTRGFYTLAELGVPFPDTLYGEFMGYRTDHDPRRRATSAGPYTSRLMTECLEKEVKAKHLRILDHLQAVRLLVHEEIVYGILCLDLSNQTEASWHLIWCRNVILATGGPAGMYHDSVYPASQLGSSGMAFEAGVHGKNLTEWQFGMASLHPRWNVSGTYMQVLPSFVSTEQDGSDEREFLSEYFKSKEEMISRIFLKGYQWPFDVTRIFGGSSVIDLLVYQETVLKGRRVYLDFRHNAGNEPIDFQSLSKEAYDYLNQAGACFGTPIERLEKMNAPAIAFYLDHRVDLHTDMLEIAVCAQHNNGGLSTNAWWETDVHGLFAIGEVNGSHGVTRPGGTALNAGQVGAVRAAECIHLRKINGLDCSFKTGSDDVKKQLRREAEEFVDLPAKACGSVPLNEAWVKTSIRMSASGGMIRNTDQIKKALQETEAELEDLLTYVKRPEASQLSLFFHLRDTLLSQYVYLSAMNAYISSGAGSRGSALYTDPDGKKAEEWMPELYRCAPDKGKHNGLIQEMECRMQGTMEHLRPSVHSSFRAVRPIPKTDYFFENQWREYRKRNQID